MGCRKVRKNLDGASGIDVRRVGEACHSDPPRRPDTKLTYAGTRRGGSSRNLPSVSIAAGTHYRVIVLR